MSAMVTLNFLMAGRDRRARRSEAGGSGGPALPISREAHTAMWTRWLMLVLLPVTHAYAAPVRDQHVEAELIAEHTSIQPGQPFWVGLRLAMDEHWHTYWKNPGDSGLGTKIKWDLPEGFTAGPIVWPYPRLIPTPPLVSYGYEKEVVLLTRITPPDDLAAGEVNLRAKATWLMCKEVCIPGKADVALALPVRPEAPTKDPRHAPGIQAALEGIPVESTGWSVEARYKGQTIELRATLPAGWQTGHTEVYFFADDEGVTEAAAPQKVSWEGRTLRVVMTRAAVASEMPARLTGVLVGGKGWASGGRTAAVAIDAVLSEGEFAAAAPSAETAGATTMTVPVALFFAFLGGLILNLMPCVFPVLSLKIVHLVEQSRETHESAIKHAVVFTAGVLASMWVLAAVLLALRGSGATVGWAFQMSSPTFVLALTILFLLIGLNMFGVFEIGVGLTRAGGIAQDRKGLAGSFFSGLLTTVAGAPCAGPFLGTVIGYALAQPAGLALLAFTAMGLGTAAPYALLSSYPRLLKALPRPGAWMETMKQLMAFPMLATAGWFASIYVKLHGGDDAVFRLLISFTLVGAAAWTFGKWTALHRSVAVRWTGRLAAAILLFAAVRYALHKSDLRMEPWSMTKIEELRRAGRPVLVDFTAEWCAICQVNKRVALEHPDVVARLKAEGISVLVADWTDQNPEVAAGLAEFGRAAVPLYLLYGRDPAKPPEILPQALTPGLVLEAIDRLH